VTIAGECYLDLGTGKVPTGPQTAGTDSALGMRKLLKLSQLRELPRYRVHAPEWIDVQYRTVSSDGEVKLIWQAGHPDHGTVNTGTVVQGVEVTIAGEYYLDLGTGEVPTGPHTAGTDAALGMRKLLKMSQLEDAELATTIAASLPGIAPGAQQLTLRDHAAKGLGMNPSGKHVLVSARFDSGEKEAKARALHRALLREGINAYIVQTSGTGDSFGDQTMQGLDDMYAMIAVCFSDYGVKTNSAYCSYYEVKYAMDEKIPILPLKLCEEWPPKAEERDGTINREGARQNRFAFKRDLIVMDWSAKPWNPAVCAAELAPEIKRLSAKQ